MDIKQPKILIIAPHSYCVTTPNHRDCDSRAGEIAEELVTVAKNANYDVKLIKSDTLRSNHDYNRHESVNTPWRQNVRNYIESNSDSPIIIYETHSFPPIGTEFADGSQMALLAIDEYYNGTKKMHDYLTKDAGIKVHNAINRTRVNNLMLDTTKYSNIKHHYLLEFNEDSDILSQSDSRYAVLKIFLASLFPGCVNFCQSNFFGIIITVFFIYLFFIWFDSTPMMRMD
jgi:hypothetical protein